MSAKGCRSNEETTNANITEKQGHQNGDDDSLLDEFFAEIDSLKIHDENCDGGGGDDDEDNDREAESNHVGNINHLKSRCRHKVPQKQQQKQKEQESMIDRAETTKDNWKTFTISELSSPSRSTSPISTLNAPARKPISFSLGVAANAKKKTKKKNRAKITRREREEKESGTSLAFDDDGESLSSPSPSQYVAQQQNRPTQLTCQNHLLVPRWIAVLDTCAILESYESVCNIIQLARNASEAAATAPNSHHPTPSYSSPQRASEPLTIVVPYTVWDELDYRSKEIDDEHQRYKARRAARMLTDELRTEQKKVDRRRNIGGNSPESDTSRRDSIRSQSRIESHRAVEEFVLMSTATASKPQGIANDDKILACALYEQDRFLAAMAPPTAISPVARASRIPTMAGGVVLITSDKVLSGKARADCLSVYSPAEFVRYYNKRMVSLRSRASATKSRNHH